MRDFGDLVQIVIDLALSVAPLLLALIVFMFFFGIALFIFASGNGNEKQIERGKVLMTWGVIAMFVVFSFWGLSVFVRKFFFPNGIPAGPPVPNSDVIVQ